MRRLARRPRAFVRAVRANRGVAAVQHRSRNARARAGLAIRSLGGGRARRAEWARFAAEVGSLAPAPALLRSVSIVVMAPAGTHASDLSGFAPQGTHAEVDVVVVGAATGETLAAAAARAAGATQGDLLCFMLASTKTLDAGWLARLAAAIDGSSIVAAAPLVVHPLRPTPRATPHDGRVRARGLDVDIALDAPVIRACEAGAHAGVAGPPVTVPGATAACLLVDRRAYSAAGSLPDLDGLDLAAFELCRRLRMQGGDIVVVPGAVVVDHRPVDSRAALVHPVPTDTPAWRSYVEEHGPELMREARPLPEGRLRITLTVSVPSEKVAPRWGDWHLAEAFARALRRDGHVVRVQTRDHADDLAGRACDVHCVIRGLYPVRRTSGQTHVLWIISHPETVTTAECDEADLVLVASARFADSLRARTRTPVEVFLQATDADRFRPGPVVPEHAHEVAIVAKSRDVFRAAVADAVAAGLRPAIYGSGWAPFVDPALVVREYVPNDELPKVYASVGVLLNDHWQAMREWGFVSNRLFDALACATPVISDDLPELEEIFEGAVLSYHDVNELRDLVESALADPAVARARAARGRAVVIEHHTFERRARELVDALRRHDLR
jgi:glycosyltransferase involved in cell wall biosynthesis